MVEKGQGTIVLSQDKDNTETVLALASLHSTVPIVWSIAGTDSGTVL
jgi:hypothetical protein